MRKIRLLLAIAFVGLLIGLVIFWNLPAKEQAALIPHFDVPEEYVSVRDVTDAEQNEIRIYRYGTLEDDAYAIGMNQYNQPVFKDPHAAVTSLYANYSDALKAMGDTAGSIIGSSLTGKIPELNTHSDDPILRERMQFVVEFIVIFSNSFHK